MTPINTVSEGFVSHTIDLWRIRWGKWNTITFTDPNINAMAKAYSPAFLRIGGTAQDNTTYDMAAEPTEPPFVPGPANPEVNIPHGTLTRVQWDQVNEFANTAGWKVILGLNIYSGWSMAAGTSQYDPSNALELMNYTKSVGYNIVGWELGNEPNLNGKGITPQQVGASFDRLMDAIPGVYPDCCGAGTTDSPWIFGPDTTKTGASFLGDTLKSVSKYGIDVVTWHHYYVAGGGTPVDPEIFLEPSTYESYEDIVAEMKPKYTAYADARPSSLPAPKLWMGETAGVGGGTSNSESVIGKYIGIFWTADKLGVAARTGHSVVARQEWGELTANGNVAPELWVGLLWKRVMGLEVFQLTSSQFSQYVRSYVHRDSASGAFSVVIINFGSWDARVTLDEVAGGQREEYHVTSPDLPNLEGTRVAVNGQVLASTFATLALDNGAIPEFVPNYVASTHPVDVQAFSVVFVRLSGHTRGHHIHRPCGHRC